MYIIDNLLPLYKIQREHTAITESSNIENRNGNFQSRCHVLELRKRLMNDSKNNLLKSLFIF